PRIRVAGFSSVPRGPAPGGVPQPASGTAAAVSAAAPSSRRRLIPGVVTERVEPERGGRRLISSLHRGRAAGPADVGRGSSGTRAPRGPALRCARPVGAVLRGPAPPPAAGGGPGAWVPTRITSWHGGTQRFP